MVKAYTSLLFSCDFVRFALKLKNFNLHNKYIMPPNVVNSIYKKKPTLGII